MIRIAHCRVKASWADRRLQSDSMAHWIMSPSKPRAAKTVDLALAGQSWHPEGSAKRGDREPSAQGFERSGKAGVRVGLGLKPHQHAGERRGHAGGDKTVARRDAAARLGISRAGDQAGADEHANLIFFFAISPFRSFGCPGHAIIT